MRDTKLTGDVAERRSGCLSDAASLLRERKFSLRPKPFEQSVRLLRMGRFPHGFPLGYIPRETGSTGTRTKPFRLRYDGGMARTRIHIETGPAGWLRASWRRDRGRVENVVFVRFQPPTGERSTWLIDRVAPSRQSLGRLAALVADAPLYRIEEAVNASDVFRDGLLARLHDAEPDDLDAAHMEVYREMPQPKLKRPSRSELGDDFYREVATAYRKAVAAGLPPVETMARNSRIPRGTINRWIAEARDPRRGFLPPAEPGRVST
jgi:hypothetical protein